VLHAVRLSYNQPLCSFRSQDKTRNVFSDRVHISYLRSTQPLLAVTAGIVLLHGCLVCRLMSCQGALALQDLLKTSNLGPASGCNRRVGIDPADATAAIIAAD